MLEAALIIRELAHCIGSGDTLNAQECLHILHEARGVLQEANPKLTLAQGVEQMLDAKKHRRATTRRELTYYTEKILTCNPELAAREIRFITTAMCKDALECTFQRISTRCKARSILHGVFSFCCRRGWLARNPVDAIPSDPPQEKEIKPLSLDEIRRLLNTTLLPQFRECAPAVGIMLWCGIRPTEVARLRCCNVHLNSLSITLNSSQSKTGGKRSVSIHAPLLLWLRRFCAERSDDTPICPRGWTHKWGNLHRACGLHPWVPDVLRHTFASYYAVHFRNLESLQLEMGHRSTQMLRFRYVSSSYISRKDAASFWNPQYWQHILHLPTYPS